MALQWYVPALATSCTPHILQWYELHYCFVLVLFYFKEVTEAKNARQIFEGRLTTDMVTEKLYHSNYTGITSLNLQFCSIR